jgi:hypothetical protein
VQVAAGGGQEVGHCRIVLSHVRDVFAELFSAATRGAAAGRLRMLRVRVPLASRAQC